MKLILPLSIFAVATAIATLSIANSAAPLAASSIPPGTIVAYAGTASNVIAPQGWLLCDGRALSSKDPQYLSLFRVIQQINGDGSTGLGHGPNTDFNLPDYRGVFLRGVDNGRGVAGADESRSAATAGAQASGVGSIQQCQIQTHSHTTTVDIPAQSITFSAGHTDQSGYGDQAGWREPGAGNTSTEGTSGFKEFKNDFVSQPAGGTETRPVNVYVNYLIKL